MIALVAAAAIGGCMATGPYRPPPAADAAVVYVVGRGWHSDIALPASELGPEWATLTRSLPGLQVLSFGFGERAYLMADDVTLGGMLAALLPSRSALLVTALKAPPEAAFGADQVVALNVSRDGLRRIEARIRQEFALSASGQPIVMRGGPYPGSVFYAARDTYDALNTCNTWSASVLRAGGLPMPTAGVVFVGQVMAVVRSLRASGT